MDAAAIRSEMRDVVAEHGPWTAHNIHLGEGVYTIVPGIEGDNELRLRRIVQIVSDVGSKPIAELRVLDLGCLEGLFAVEFASRGAEVVGLEGRDANIAKARFAKDALALDNLELVQDDIRNLSRERYGEFDVVLCLGVLYHFDAPDVFEVLEHVAEVCRGLAIVETHISTIRRARFTHAGRTYWGSTLDEPTSSASEVDRRLLWASLGNPRSVLLTQTSLQRARALRLHDRVREPHARRGRYVARLGHAARREERASAAPLGSGGQRPVLHGSARGDVARLGAQARSRALQESRVVPGDEQPRVLPPASTPSRARAPRARPARFMTGPREQAAASETPRLTWPQMLDYWRVHDRRFGDIDYSRDPEGLTNICAPGQPLWLGRYYARFQLEVYERLLSRIPHPAPGMRALDVGCGAGRWCALLARRSYRVTGIDIQPTLITENRRRLPEIEFFEVPLQDFTYDDRFDLVSSVTVLQHLPFDEQPRAIERLRDLTASGGHAVVLENVRDQAPERFSRTVSGWRSLFEDAGFRTVAIEPYNYSPTLRLIGRARAVFPASVRQDSSELEVESVVARPEGRPDSPLRASLQLTHRALLRLGVAVDTRVEPRLIGGRTPLPADELWLPLPSPLATEPTLHARPTHRRTAMRRVRTFLVHPVVGVLGVPLAWVVERLLRLSSRQIGVALIYHSVDATQGDLEHELVPPHGSRLFAAQVRHLRRRYNVVDAERLLASVAKRRRGERFPVAITFDDDLACHPDVVVPILAGENVTATFFLTGSSLEGPFAFWWERLQRAVDAGLDAPELPGGASGSRPSRSIHDLGRDFERLSPEDRDRISAALAEQLGPDPAETGLRVDGVRTLVAARMKVGFHTLRHDPLPMLDDDALALAMTAGRANLEAVAEQRLTVIAYPHGHVDSRVAAAARAAGFEWGYTTRLEPVRPASNPLLLGRLSPSYRSTGHFALQLVRFLARKS